MEAVHIIDFNKRLEEKFPNTQFLWRVSSDNFKYTNNYVFEGNWDNCIEQMKETHPNSELIQLTIHNDTVYYE